MDNLRGQFPDYDDPSNTPSVCDEDAAGDLPPASIGKDERRMQVRAYNFWASLLEDRSFPRIGSLDPSVLPDFGPYSVLLDFTTGIENPRVVFLGDTLGGECGAEGEIHSLADVPSRSLLSRITDHYMQILANQAPIGFEAEFVNQRGITILYRGILLPFCGDDETIDYIYGVINWKELADQKTTDALMLQIDQALDTPAARPREAMPLTDWADGPADFSIGDGAPAPGEALDLSGYDLGLADWLASARDSAREARSSEDRSRGALYAAIGRAYDFALAAAEAPEEYAAMIAEAGLAVQDRAPLTALVKLVFGADYDKTRLTEYATAIGHGQRLGLPASALGDHLASTPGGLKAIIAEERALRRAEAGHDTDERRAPRTALLRKLRAAPAIALAELPAQGEEFTLFIARRLESGEIAFVGEVAGQPALLERAARAVLG